MEAKKDGAKIIEMSKVWQAVWQKRKLFLWVWPIVFVLSCIWILPQPRFYVASVSLAPETSGADLGGGLSSIASSFGINIGGMESTDAIYPLLYPELFESPEFTVGLLDIQVTTADGELSTDYYTYLHNHQKPNWLTKPFTDLSRWISEQFEDEDAVVGGDVSKVNAFRMSRKDYAIVTDIQEKITCVVDKKTNVTTITVQDQDALVSAILADSVKQRLQDFIIQYRTSKARLDVDYYQHLTDSARIEYEKAVHEYSDYCDSHKNVILQAYLSKRDEMEERVQLRLSTYRAMNTQLEAMQAKVQECTPAFTTLKSASVPVKPAGPKRMIFVGVMLVLSTFVTALYAARHVIRQK